MYCTMTLCPRKLPNFMFFLQPVRCPLNKLLH
uniref:Uncharacterized protein n=1 Tax=Anguilla anguilla TaxID=7936 RepID=A0A0E9RPT8_ANGAN